MSVSGDTTQEVTRKSSRDKTTERKIMTLELAVETLNGMLTGDSIDEEVLRSGVASLGDHLIFAR